MCISLDFLSVCGLFDFFWRVQRVGGFSRVRWVVEWVAGRGNRKREGAGGGGEREGKWEKGDGKVG